MEKCVFCGNTRKSAPNVRFFAVPREPGLKRIQWLYVLGDKGEQGAKNRVCGLHFRQGRPSSDPSHEDFVPHLYLNREPPEEILNYLESLTDDSNSESNACMSASSNQTTTMSKPSNADSAQMKPAKPSILQRKRKQKLDELEENPQLIQKQFNPSAEAAANPSKIHILHKSIAEAVGAKHGQAVVIKRMVAVKKKQTANPEETRSKDISSSTTQSKNLDKELANWH
uniref:THAP-type domain-containing protein n=1 Tax=Ditylenchus dipsaci TaxID=166011 RepID=A0A915D7B4_9BILA